MPLLAMSLDTRTLPAPWRYLLAVLLSGVTLGIAVFLTPVLYPNMGPPLFAGAAVATWLCGFGPGLLTAVLTSAGFAYFFVDPAHAHLIAGASVFWRIASILLALLLVTLLTALIERRRAALIASETRYKALSERLASSNKELEQFAYVASHDLQEPLRMVASYTELLGEKYRGKLDGDADKYIAYAVDGARRMQVLINDLLKYSRIERQQFAATDVDANAVLEDVLKALQKSIEESGAIVAHDPLPTVNADRTLFVQLFQNLIGNAIKFRGEQPPQVSVAAQANGREWIFSVRDNGIGIDPRYGERIFQMFQRLHRRDQYPGTGIGLAICKKVVERHGGRIWMESEPGRGSAFYFTLPAG